MKVNNMHDFVKKIKTMLLLLVRFYVLFFFFILTLEQQHPAKVLQKPKQMKLSVDLRLAQH